MKLNIDFDFLLNNDEIYDVCALCELYMYKQVTSTLLSGFLHNIKAVIYNHRHHIQQLPDMIIYYNDGDIFISRYHKDYIYPGSIKYIEKQK